MPQDTAVVPLATTADFQALGGLALLVRDYDPDALTRLMIRATRSLESRCDRRLAPFTALVESSRALGVDSTQFEAGSWPLDLTAALGRSQARAYATNTLVRDVWLAQYAPVFPDMWAYSDVSVQLARPYGDTQQVLATSLEGPEPDTGHFRFRLGTFVPVGTTLRVTYSGGYQTVPDDLNLACCYQAAKLAILTDEPQSRTGMSVADLDAEICTLAGPWMRGGRADAGRRTRPSR